MSDELGQIEQALQNIVGTGMVTGYYLVGEFIGEDGKRYWLADYPEEQSLAHSVGLLEWGRLTIRAEVQDYFDRLAIASIVAEEEGEEDDGDH